jgi:hypothetical protein
VPLAHDDPHVIHVIEDEIRRCWYLLEAIVAELRHRGRLAQHEAERLAIIAEWDAETGDEHAVTH